MDRRHQSLLFTALGSGVIVLAMACGSLSPYPPVDSNLYDAGYQGVTFGVGGGTLPSSSSSGNCFAFGEGGFICPDSGGGLPDAAPPPPCSGCTLIAAANTPQSIALDVKHVYWTEGDGNLWTGGYGIAMTGNVNSAARGVGGIVTNIATSLTGPWILRQSSGQLVFSSIQGLGNDMSMVSTVPAAAGSTAVTVGPLLHDAQGVAIDSTTAYWTTADSMAINSLVESAPVGGGAVTTLATTTIPVLSTGMAVNGTDIYFLAYSMSPQMGYLFQIPKTGGVPNQLWTSSSAASVPVEVVLDGSNAYWTDSAAGAVYAMPLGGGAASTLASGLSSPNGIAVDSTNIYFTDNNAVYELSKGGGSPNALAPVGGRSYAVAADDADPFVYFTTLASILAVGK